MQLYPVSKYTLLLLKWQRNIFYSPEELEKSLFQKFVAWFLMNQGGWEAVERSIFVCLIAHTFWNFDSF